jgi:3-hydroxymyristoyl/3-hydroxydecanoyl-(acyl carrier protein) dehydratase
VGAKAAAGPLDKDTQLDLSGPPIIPYSINRHIRKQESFRSMPHKNVLVIGARAGGYGESIAKKLLKSGYRVFGTSLNPKDPREIAYFHDIGVELVDVPLKFQWDRRDGVFRDFEKICDRLRGLEIARLDAVIHAVAGGFPRHPSVMKAVGDILKGEQTFDDLATAVKRNLYYVNARSFDDTIKGLAPLADDRTVYIALTYRGKMPYFISPTKKSLERLARRNADAGRRALVVAFPEAWTQSSQFFSGIEIAVMTNYLKELAEASQISEDIAKDYALMPAGLKDLGDMSGIVHKIKEFETKYWTGISENTNLGELSTVVQGFLDELRAGGADFTTFRNAVEIISEFVRSASAGLLVREFIEHGRFTPGDVRQIYYKDLTGTTEIGLAAPRPETKPDKLHPKKWVVFERDEIRKVLSMYGENFLFVDRIVAEDSDIYDGYVAFARFTVPTPDKNPILKDHFVDMPLFGGHLQMEAVAQFGTFLILHLMKERKMLPILTGTEFPDLNTMAPPGETLTMKGIIRMRRKRNLRFEAYIENRYARSKGVIKGIIVNQRVLRKMMDSFNAAGSDSED